MRNGRGLEIRAFDHAQVRLELQETLEVGGRAVQVRLQDDADILVPAPPQALVDLEGRGDEPRLLHVDPHELAETAGVGDDPLEVVVRRLGVERESEVRELESDVRAQAFVSKSIEDRFVRGDGRCGPGGVGNRLTEERRVRVQPGVVQSAQYGHALVERLPGDEASGSEPHAVTVDDPSQQGAVGRAQDGGSRKSGDGRGEDAHRQFSDGSGGMRARTPNGPPLRSRTALQSSSGSTVNTSSTRAGSTIQEPSSSSPSSCPGPQPA